MNYNRWMPQEYQSGGELYHYGVKGMKWKNKKGITTQSTNATGGGGAIDSNASAPGSFAAEEAQYAYDQNATYRAMQKYNEAHKPAWQKKWDKSSAKKELWKIKQKIKKKFNIQTVKNKPKKKKKSKIKVTYY